MTGRASSTIRTKGRCERGKDERLNGVIALGLGLSAFRPQPGQGVPRRSAFRPGLAPLDDQLSRRPVDLFLARFRLLRDQLGEDAARWRQRGHGPLAAAVPSIHISHIDVDIPASPPLCGLSLDRLHPFSKRRHLGPQRLDLPTQVVPGFL